MSEDPIDRKMSGSFEDQGAISGQVKTASQTPGMQKE
jgi:hypothetical protein